MAFYERIFGVNLYQAADGHPYHFGPRLSIVRMRSIAERLARKTCEFDCVRLPNAIEINRSIKFDCRTFD